VVEPTIDVTGWLRKQSDGDESGIRWEPNEGQVTTASRRWIAPVRWVSSLHLLWREMQLIANDEETDGTTNGIEIGRDFRSWKYPAVGEPSDARNAVGARARGAG
jgi:hypothetical protein